MDEFEQRFTFKPLHLKGWGNKRIITELESTFQGSALSMVTVKQWLRKFKSGDLSRPDWRPVRILGPFLKKFLDKYPFVRAKIMSRHFDTSPWP
jgi:hypothetical protein